MINLSIGRAAVTPLLWFSFLSGQLVVEIKKGSFEPHTACCMKLIENAIHWKDRGNPLLAHECLHIALSCLKSMDHDAVLGSDDEELEFVRETQEEVEYYIHEVAEELRLIKSDISAPIKSVSSKRKQRLVHNLEKMKAERVAFWEEWAEESLFICPSQEVLISNVTEKEFILPSHPPCKRKKRVADDSSPRDVCDLTCEIDARSVSNKKRKMEI